MGLTSKGKDVKSGGGLSTNKAGTQPSGRPAAKLGGGSRGEFKQEAAGTQPSGGPGKEYSNRSGGEYAQATAGRK